LPDAESIQAALAKKYRERLDWLREKLNGVRIPVIELVCVDRALRDKEKVARWSQSDKNE